MPTKNMERFENCTFYFVRKHPTWKRILLRVLKPFSKKARSAWDAQWVEVPREIPTITSISIQGGDESILTRFPAPEPISISFTYSVVAEPYE